MTTETNEDVIFTFDTETTGLLNYALKAEDGGTDIAHPNQPHIVQLAATLCNAKGEELETLNVLIKPDETWLPDENGDIIHPKAQEVHGYSIERLEAEGMPIVEALELFNAMKAKCTKRIGFNVSFDKQMLASVAMRAGIEHESKQPSICVMRAAGAIMKMAPTDRMMAAGRKGNKPPKLTEAYEHFFGEPLVKAHDALADVRATTRIYFKILELHGDAYFEERAASKTRETVSRDTEALTAF